MSGKLGMENTDRSKKASEPPSVYLAKDYRSFLKQYYQHKKARNPAFSFQAFSRQLGFRSRSHLQLIIAKKRNLGPESVDKFEILFRKQPRQFDFFRKLVEFDQEKSPSRKASLAADILKEKNRLRIRSLRFEWYELYSSWHHFPILFMPKLPGFSESPPWIQSRLLFPLSAREIAATKSKLLKMGLWIRERGNIKIAEELLSSYDQLAPERLKAYHQRILALSVDAVGLPQAERYVSGSTLALSQGDFNSMTDELHDFKRELFLKYSSSSQDADDARIYQIELVAFPYSRSHGGSPSRAAPIPQEKS